MYVEAGENGGVVREAHDLKSLSVRAAGPGALAALGALGTPSDDGAHVWLSIDALRAAGAAAVDEGERDSWTSGFDGMIAYASSKGWTSEDGRSVRAHVETA